MSITVVTANVPAGRVSTREGHQAVENALRDLLLGQELEEYSAWLSSIPNYKAIIFDDEYRQRELPILYKASRLEVKTSFVTESTNTRWGWNPGVIFKEIATGKDFLAMNVHPPNKTNKLLNPGAYRAYVEMVNTLVNISKIIDLPMVVGGDWNKEPDSPFLAPLRKAGFRAVSPGNTHGLATRRPTAIDFFMVRGVRVVRSRVLEKTTGDHAPVAMTFEIPA